MTLGQSSMLKQWPLGLIIMKHTSNDYDGRIKHIRILATHTVEAACGYDLRIRCVFFFHLSLDKKNLFKQFTRKILFEQ